MAVFRSSTVKGNCTMMSLSFNNFRVSINTTRSTTAAVVRRRWENVAQSFPSRVLSRRNHHRVAAARKLIHKLIHAYRRLPINSFGTGLFCQLQCQTAGFVSFLDFSFLARRFKVTRENIDTKV